MIPVVNERKKLAEMINDPFHGKEGFMPAKIDEKINVRIGLNENLAFPENIMKKLLIQVANKIDPRIYPEDYCDSLCELIAEDLKLNSNQVVIGNGGDKIIDLMVRLTIVKGKSAIVINPTYPMFEHAIKIQGGLMKELFLTPAPDFDLDTEIILANIDPKNDRLMFLCSPNNPTGNQFVEEKLVQLISEFPGIIALDETYTDFGGRSMVSRLGEFPNLIIMKSMSKFYALAGMRVGYALADPFIISRIKELHPAFNVNSASLELAKSIVQEKELLKSVKTEIIAERKRVFSELKNIDGITPYTSLTNFISFNTGEIRAAEIRDKLLKQYGILVRDMSAMPLLDNTLRMTITT